MFKISGVTHIDSQTASQPHQSSCCAPRVTTANMLPKPARSIWVSVVVLASLALPATATNLVVNGSFEDTGSRAYSYKIDDPSTDVLPNWSASPVAPNNIVDCLVYNGATTQICGTNPVGGIADNLSLWTLPGVPNGFTAPKPGESPDGGNYLLMDADSKYNSPVTQTITNLIVGQFYQLTFWQAAGQENGFTGATNETWQVTFGAQVLNAATMNNASKGAVNWNFQTLVFKASATSQILSFFATTTSPTGLPPIALLDGVNMQVVTPEPGSWVMMGIAILSIPLARRRLKKLK